MYNIILRRVCESLLPWKSKKHYMFVCVCVCACGCPVAHVALLIQHARHNHAPYCDAFVAPQAPPYSSALSQKRCDFQKKIIEHKMYVLISSTFV
jgi:hypothetical protein